MISDIIIPIKVLIDSGGGTAVAPVDPLAMTWDDNDTLLWDDNDQMDWDG